MFWDKWFKKAEPNPPKEMRLLRDFKELDISFIENLFSSDMSIFTVTPGVPTLLDYSAVLKTLIWKLQNNKQITPQEISLEPNVRYFQDFVIGVNGPKSLKYKENFSEWRDYCVQLLEEYSKLEDKIQKEFIEERNYFLLSPVISNLSIILTEMKSESKRTSNPVRE